MSRDHTNVLRKIDRSAMLERMGKTPSRLNPPPDGVTTCPDSFVEPRNVVVGGVGGSGIAGDIIADYLKAVGDIPISVCRALQIPSYVDERTLFLAISYSGETRETLRLLEEATKRKAMLASITSGGGLLSISIARRIPYLKVPADLPPRVALPELVSSALFVMERAGVLKHTDRILADASRSVASLIESITPEEPAPQNEAMRMAETLRGRLPLLFGPEERVSVLRRFKNELNENSKVPAFYMSVPECYHDDIEGLRTLSRLCSVQPILLLAREETEGQIKTREALYSLLDELSFPHILTFEGHGGNMLSELLTADYFRGLCIGILSATQRNRSQQFGIDTSVQGSNEFELEVKDEPDYGQRAARQDFHLVKRHCFNFHFCAMFASVICLSRDFRVQDEIVLTT